MLSNETVQGQERERARIERNMTSHPPENDSVGRSMDEIRGAFKRIAYQVVNLVPGGREQAQALTAVEDALMYSIAGIARNQTTATALADEAGI